MNTLIAVRPFTVPVKSDIETFGGTMQNQVNMVWPDVEFHNFASQSPAEYFNAVVNFASHHPFRDAVSAIRHPDQIILAMPYRM